jgi:hypothetical protein
MRLQSLVPFREGGALMRPDTGLFTEVKEAA